MGKNAVIIYAYGEDAYFAPQHQDIVGVATSPKSLMSLLKQEKGMTKEQYEEIKNESFNLFTGEADEIQLDYIPDKTKCAYRVIPFKLDVNLTNMYLINQIQ